MITDRRSILAVGAATLAAGSALAAGAKPAPMNTTPLFTLRLQTAATQDLGDAGHGKRVFYPITGGTFEGPRLKGHVLPGGSDWTTTRNDGVMELDLRITLETDDKALIYMTFAGLRRGDYFRTLPRFETGAASYAFLNQLLALGIGEITAEGPVHRIAEIL